MINDQQRLDVRDTLANPQNAPAKTPVRWTTDYYKPGAPAAGGRCIVPGTRKLAATRL